VEYASFIGSRDQGTKAEGQRFQLGFGSQQVGDWPVHDVLRELRGEHFLAGQFLERGPSHGLRSRQRGVAMQLFHMFMCLVFDAGADQREVVRNFENLERSIRVVHRRQ
jgi:hypothetical protein